MNFEDIKKAILELKPEEQVRLMKELGPELCQSMMDEPDMMGKMMSSCCGEMMKKHPGVMRYMRDMMTQMQDISEKKSSKKKG